MNNSKGFTWGKLHTTILAGVLGLFVIMSTIGINDNGYRTVVQLPNGTTFVKFTPGMYFSLFGSTEEYQDVVSQPLKGQVRYQDGGTGSVDGIVRVALPNDEGSMLKLHRAVRSVEGFRTKILKPEVRQALNLTAGLMTSEEAYTVKRSDYVTWADEQLSNGPYETVLTDKTVKTTDGKTQTKKVPTIALDNKQQPIHQASSFADYSLSVTGFQITDWDFEPKTLKQIADKRAAEMAIITAKANADKAVWQQKEIKANGEKEVERVRYAELQIAEKATIEATRVKDVAVIRANQQVQTNTEALEAAKVDAETAKQEAMATKTRADAEAYAKKAVIMADGALDKKLKAFVSTQTVWADAYARRNVPSMVMGGGSDQAGGNADTSQFMAMMQALTAKQLVLDPNVSK